MIRLKETELKTIKRDSGLPDTFFVSKYGFSPYRGCQHACAYCDGRAERYYVEGVFDQDIEARVNSAQLLDSFLMKTRERGIVGVSSGVSDAYQPVETRLKLMPDILDTLIRHNTPAYMMTKSVLPLRDLEKWKKLNDTAGATLFVSLTTVDDAIAKVFEPCAAKPTQRLRMIRAFKEAGIGVIVLAMPFMPEITGTPKQMNALFNELSTIGVDAVMPAGMTLRPGKQKEHFLEVLRGYNSDLLPLYSKIYSENRTSGGPMKKYMDFYGKQLEQAFSRHNLISLVPHNLYSGRMQIYDEIYVLLYHMTQLYKYKNIDTTRLKESYKRYKNWLESEKQKFSKKRQMSGDDLDCAFTFMHQTGAFRELIGNDKLTDFLEKVIFERAILDYKTLKLKD